LPGLVDPILDQARPGDIPALITKSVNPSEADNQSAIIVQKLREHILGLNISLIVVRYALKSRDVSNRVQGTGRPK
jgi:hypothetical protein